MSLPIPVYQRPAEFYAQQSELSQGMAQGDGGGGRRRGAGGGGVDFSNLILLTRGGKGYSRAAQATVNMVDVLLAQRGVAWRSRSAMPPPRKRDWLTFAQSGGQRNAMDGRDIFSDLALRGSASPADVGTVAGTSGPWRHPSNPAPRVPEGRLQEQTT